MHLPGVAKPMISANKPYHHHHHYHHISVSISLSFHCVKCVNLPSLADEKEDVDIVNALKKKRRSYKGASSRDFSTTPPPASTSSSVGLGGRTDDKVRSERRISNKPSHGVNRSKRTKRDRLSPWTLILRRHLATAEGDGLSFDRNFQQYRYV